MPDRNEDSALAQSLDHIAFSDVRALHFVTQIVHDFGNARHADAANPDEMDRADIGRDALHDA